MAKLTTNATVYLVVYSAEAGTYRMHGAVFVIGTLENIINEPVAAYGFGLPVEYHKTLRTDSVRDVSSQPKVGALTMDDGRVVWARTIVTLELFDTEAEANDTAS